MSRFGTTLYPNRIQKELFNIVETSKEDDNLPRNVESDTVPLEENKTVGTQEKTNIVISCPGMPSSIYMNRKLNMRKEN